MQIALPGQQQGEAESQLKGLIALLELDESQERAFRAALAKREAKKDAALAELLAARARIKALEGLRGELHATAL